MNEYPRPGPFLVLLLTLLGLCAPALGNHELTLGMFAYRPKPVLEARWQPLVDYLNQALPGHTLRLRVLDQEEIQAALRRKELDFVFTNPTHYILLREHNALSGALATLVNLEGNTPAASLGGVIIRAAGRDDLKRLADLRGKTIAAVGPDALGGYVAQVAELSRAGIRPEHLRVTFTGRPHDRVIEAVLTGKADAGFLRSTVIEQLSQEGRLDLARLKVLNPRSYPGYAFAVSTPLYPEWPFVALPRVEESIARLTTAALLSLTPDHPASRAAGIMGFTIPADYSPVERAMRDLRLPPYDQTPAFTWRDVWSRYQIQILVALLAGAAILLLAVLLAAGNRRLAEARRQAQHYANRFEHESRHLKTLVHALPDLVWLKDTEGVYLGCNPRFERFFGAPESGIVGRTDYDFVDRELADSFREHDRRAMAKGEPSVNEEWVSFADDGHRELLETTKTPMFDGRGRLIGVLGIGHDITERKRLEDALRQREQYQRALLDNFPFMVWLKDNESRFLAVNQSFAAAFGAAAPDSLVGKTDFDIAPPDMAEATRADDRAVLESRRHKNVEEEVLDQGARKWLEVYKAPVMTDGRVIGTVGFARDITDRKRTERALNEATLLLRETQSIAGLGGWKANPAENKVIWTEEIYRLVEHPLDSPPPGLEETMGHVAPEFAPAVRRNLTESWENGTPFTMEIEAVAASGRHFWAEFRCIGRVESEDGVFLTGTFQDISARKQVEDLQRYSAFQAGVAEMSVSVLHNIGNAITSVVSDTNAVSRTSEDLARVAALLHQSRADFARRARPDGLDASQAGHLLDVQRQAAETIERLCERGLFQRSRRINDSVQHIADIVRIQQNAAIPSASNRPFDLGRAIWDAVAMQADTLKQHDIRAEVEIDPSLAPVTLSRNRLLQALLNVLKNAYEAIRERQDGTDFEGVIVVCAEALDGDRFRIRVTDNGIGVAPEQRSGLFRFGYSTKSRGSGFGLHATALFVQELDGAISLSSDGPNRGATLEMTLPRAAGKSGATDPRPATGPEGDHP
jgi:PAS domain S-box-containing protein